MKKYVIKFNWISTQETYVRDMHQYAPMLTPQIHLIKPEYMYDNSEDAKIGLNSVVSHMIKVMSTEQKPARLSHAYSGYRRLLAFTDPTRYSVVEVNPEFIFKKNRKSHTKQWVEGSLASFCHVCGTNTVGSKYYKVGQSRICPFCIKNLSVDAQSITDELKKETPDIEESHMASTFIGHME